MSRYTGDYGFETTTTPAGSSNLISWETSLLKALPGFSRRMANQIQYLRNNCMAEDQKRTSL